MILSNLDGIIYIQVTLANNSPQRRQAMKIKNRLLLTHGLLILLALIIVFVNALAYRSMKDDSDTVNNLGRLRALSHNMGRIASQLSVENIEEQRAKLSGDLHARKTEFEATLTLFEALDLKYPKANEWFKCIANEWYEIYDPLYVNIIDGDAEPVEYKWLNENIENYVQDINELVKGFSKYSDDKVYKALRINAILVIVLVFAATYSLMTMNRRVRKPIDLLISELKDYSLIDDEISKQLKTINSDEISEMGQYFNVMIYDQLTLVYNRRAGLAKLERLIDNTGRSSFQIGLCFIDINGLKKVNDTLGHKYGDELIVIVAECIKKVIREKDFIIRMGGDEFLIILLGANVNEAENIWSRIKACYDTINTEGDRDYLISVSHGVVVYDSNKDVELEALIKEADEKMYEEKRYIKKTLKEVIKKQK
jgi:diguanylate cyclase (GGDEF)-like protein